MITYHCDRQGCDTWSNSWDDFIAVYYSRTRIKFYCCKWCMVVEESRDAEPTETIDL